MPDHYGVFEQGNDKAKKYMKKNVKGLYSVKVMLEGLRLYLKEGKHVQEHEVTNAPKEMEINGDKTKVKRLKVPRRYKKMIFFTQEGTRETFAHFRDVKKKLRKYDEEKMLKTMDKIASML